MPTFRATISYTTRSSKKPRTMTRVAEVADFTKLTRPMKRDIRRRFPSADISDVRIQRKSERRQRRRTKAA